jgi:hypothetical protein
MKPTIKIGRQDGTEMGRACDIISQKKRRGR